MKIKLCIMSLVAMALSAMENRADAQTYRAQVDNVFFNRDDNRESYDLFRSPVDRLHTEDDYPTTYEWGRRFVFGREHCGSEFELSYMRIDGWQSRIDNQRLNGVLDLDNGAPNSLDFTTAIGRASLIEVDPDTGILNQSIESLEEVEYNTSYESTFQDAQANYVTRQNALPFLKIGVGVRWAQLDEIWNLNVTGEFKDAQNLNGELTPGALAAAGLVPVAGGGGFQDIRTPLVSPVDILNLNWRADTNNQLLGGQLISNATLYNGEFFVFDFFGRGGVFHNRITSRLRETDREQIKVVGAAADAWNLELTDRADTVSFLGGAGGSLSLKLRENVRIKFGYEAIFISDVALAIDQWKAVQVGNTGALTYTVDSSGTIFAHGGSLGLEAFF